MTNADELATTLELAQWATRRMTARPTSVTTKANAARAGADVRGEDGEPTLFPASGGILVAGSGIADGVWRAWTAPA